MGIFTHFQTLRIQLTLHWLSRAGTAFLRMPGPARFYMNLVPSNRAPFRRWSAAATMHCVLPRSLEGIRCCHRWRTSSQAPRLLPPVCVLDQLLLQLCPHRASRRPRGSRRQILAHPRLHFIPNFPCDASPPDFKFSPRQRSDRFTETNQRRQGCTVQHPCFPNTLRHISLLNCIWTCIWRFVLMTIPFSWPFHVQDEKVSGRKTLKIFPRESGRRLCVCWLGCIHVPHPKWLTAQWLKLFTESVYIMHVITGGRLWIPAP